MYPRNAASPERIPVGAVIQISDGAVQTSGVSVSVLGQGGTTGAGGGTVAYENGVVIYTPTQAETNYTSFIVTAYKTGCIPVSVGVVTHAGTTPGKPPVTVAAADVSGNVAADVQAWDGGAVPTIPGAAPSASDIKTAIEAAGSSLAQILEDTGTTLPAAIAAISGGDSREDETWNYDADGNLLSIDYLTTGKRQTFNYTGNRITSATWGDSPV